MHRTFTRSLVLIILFLTGYISLNAQTILSGTVADSTGEALIGATIRIKGNEGVGTVTDIDGRFSFDSPQPSGTLIFSYVGYKTKEAEFGPGKTNFTISLSSEEILDELVVVGYGTQKKSDVTGSISVTRNEDFADQPISNIAGSIQGKVSGINIRNASGTPGAGLLVSVRGQNNPLYVVDGIPMISESNSDLETSFDLSGNSVGNGQNVSSIADLNPDDIESIEILKDASATSIYGARAANGVVLITTKRGKSGKTQFDLNYYTGIQQVSRPLKFLNSKEFTALVEEGRKNDLNAYTDDPTIFGDDFDPALLTNPLPDSWHTDVNTDWMDEIFRPAPINQVEFSARGGNDRTTFYIGSSFFDQDGIIIENYYKRYNTRINLDHRVNDKFNFGENISLSYSKDRRSLNDNVYTGTVTNAIGASPLMPVYNEDGTYASFEDYQASWLSDNPVLSTKEIIPFTSSYRALGTLFAEYNILPHLKFRTSWSIDFTDLNDDIFFSPLTVDAGQVGGKATNGNFQQIVWLGENVFSWDKELSHDQHLDAIGGFTLQKSQNHTESISGQGFPIGSDLQDVSSAALITGGSSFGSSWSLVSFIGRVNYSIRSKYLFALSARADGSSRFSPSNQFGFFPAVSAGWRMSDEDFWPQNKVFTDLKLRASYGVTGDQEIGDFQYISFWTPVTYNGQAGLGPRNLADPDLKWQTNKMLNVGFDYELWKGKIAGSFEFYSANKTDLLSEDVIPGTSGFGNITRNYGNILNRGIEFNADAILIDHKDFKWDFSFNISYLHNEIIDLSTDSTLLSAYSDLAATHILAIGQPVGSYWGVEYEGVDPQTGDPIYNDLNGDGVIDDNDATIIGKSTPDWYGGFSTGLEWKNWNLNIASSFMLGNQVYNLIKSTYETLGWSDGGWDENNILYQVYANNTHVVDDRWQQPGDQTDIPRASLINYNYYSNSSQSIEDGSHLRIRTINLGYTIHPKTIKFYNALNIFAQVENPFIFTHYTGFDPEVSSNGGDHPETAGVDYAAYPQARTYTIGFDFKF